LERFFTGDLGRLKGRCVPSFDLLWRIALKPFAYVAAHSIPEAVALLSENSPNALPIAGGTYLLVRLKQNLATPKTLVDIAGIPELQGIALNEKGLRIGAMTTHTEIVASPLVRQYAPAVAASSASVGAIQTRNLGTIGGNLVACVPSNDSAPSLLVLDALVTVAGKDGQRQIGLEELFAAPHCSALRPDELLVEILIPKERLGKPSCFAKFGRRKALTLALVNAAACVEVDGTKNRFASVRIGLGAVAPTPIRVRKAEAFLAGKPVRSEVLAEAARIAAGEAAPIDDFRASAEYRRDLIMVLTRRVIDGALSGESNR
jgi:CO/xanthine dehydrogenase FAD-binding subunit